MKSSYKITIFLSALLFTLAMWSLGFVMGNSAATLRMSRINLDRNLVSLDALEKEKVENAKANCKAMISGGFLFLQSKPFWLVALRDQFNVNSNKYYERASARAKKLSLNLRPLDKTLRESSGSDVKIEY